MTGAVVAGLILVPGTGATAARATGPHFYSVKAGSAHVVDARSVSRRATPVAQRSSAESSVALSKGLQALQVFSGSNGIGNNGISVAAGPKHVVQIGGNVVRILKKSNGGVVKTQQLGQFFGVSGITLSQGTIVYDPLGRRWFTAAVTDDGGEIGLALRASRGTSPTKWQPAVLFASADTGNPDAVELDPMIGTSTDKVVITTPITDADEPTNVNRIFFFPKSPLMSGNSPDPWTADLNSTYDGSAPAVNASSQSNIFVAIPATNDATVTTYTGAATTSAPNFSKNVVFPSTPMTAPPVVDQGGGDNLDLGPLAFSGAAWRDGRLFATATGNCSGVACVRLIGVGTESGVTLIEDEKFKSTTGRDWLSPSVAIDGAGYVHVAATDVSSSDSLGPSLAALTLTKVSLSSPAGSNLKARVIALGTGPFDDNGTAGQTVDWYGSTAAAVDPTSPWDVWVTGAVGSNVVVNPSLTTSIARVSIAKNVASLKASSTRVRKGSKVTFTLSLTRPQSKDVVAGLPVSLQRRAASGKGRWSTVAKGTLDAKGHFTTRVKVTKAGQYRTVGRPVQQVGGQGQQVDRVNGKPLSVRLR